MKNLKWGRIITGAVIGVLICTNLLAVNKISSLRAVLNGETKEIVTERKELITQYEELRDSSTEAMSKIKKYVNKDIFTNSEQSKQVLNELIELKKIAATRSNLEGVKTYDPTNIIIHDNMVNMCHSIEKFSIYLAYGLDSESSSSITAAMDEIKYIISIVEETNEIKESKL